MSGASEDGVNSLPKLWGTAGCRGPGTNQFSLARRFESRMEDASATVRSASILSETLPIDVAGFRQSSWNAGPRRAGSTSHNNALRREAARVLGPARWSTLDGIRLRVKGY